jgi:UDPglucose 6-dehydrogenase
MNQVNEKISVNILGYGFVGSACGFLCEKNNIEFNVCDTQLKNGNFNYFNNISELAYFSESKSDVNFYFICVPTPSDSEGKCDTSIVESVIKQLSLIVKKRSIVIIKSTIKPGTTRDLYNKYNEKLDIVFCPEFLREVSYKDDIYSAEFVLFGIDESQKGLINDLKDLFTNYLYKHKYTVNNESVHDSPFEFYFKSFEECELFKYTLNTFFATKITFFNEIYDLCDKIGVDYQNLKSLFKLDKRIGDYGTVVPGMDGFGYTRSCLPKEIRALIKLQEELGLSNDLAYCVDKRNDYFRSK